MSSTLARHRSNRRLPAARTGSPSRHRTLSAVVSALRNKAARVAAAAVAGSALLVFAWPAATHWMARVPSQAWADQADALGLQMAGSLGAQARQQPEIVSVGIAVVPGYRNPLRGVSGLVPERDRRGRRLQRVGPRLRSRRCCHHQRDREFRRVARRWVDHIPAHRWPGCRVDGLCRRRRHANCSGRPTRAGLDRDRQHVRSEAMVSRSDGRSPAACPRNHSFRKPGASAGLARSRPRSALASTNCSSRLEYQPRLTAPSPLTGFSLRATRRTRPNLRPAAAAATPG